MKHKQLFEKAYSRLTELYGGENVMPDVAILSRFHQEKKILGDNELYMRYLDLLSRVRERANQKGEHIFIRNTAGSSFIAYLLGATDINPLPRHEYCPHCHTAKFIGSGTPFDKAPKKCSCGTEIETDGHNLPFESNLKSVFAQKIQLCVSHAFFDEAKAMICAEMQDKTIIDIGEAVPENYISEEDRTIFEKAPRISLIREKRLDKYRELEKATGFKMRDIGTSEQSLAFFSFMDCDIRDIPHFDNAFIKGIWNTVNPKSYDHLLKLIGFAHSTNVWENNYETLFNEHKMSLREIPAFREDLYEMICQRLRQNGIYDDGLAYEVTDKATRGYYAKNEGVDEDTMLALVNIGFDMDFIFSLADISYMFNRAQGILYLREAIAMMFYKTKFNK